MAPFLPPFANNSITLNVTNIEDASHEVKTQPIPCHTEIQSQWGVDSISNIVFGIVMVFISVVAIYQARRQEKRHRLGGMFIFDGTENDSELTRKRSRTEFSYTGRDDHEEELVEYIGAGCLFTGDWLYLRGRCGL